MPAPSVAVAPAAWSGLLARIADAADEVAMRHFRSRTLRIEAKADGTPVTEADGEIEAAARRIAAAGCPGLGVLGEEYGETRGSAGARLIIDPIDATQNFMRGIPIFATLIAIEEGGEVVSGMVSAPALGVRWSAFRGAGAFRNGHRMRVSPVARLAEAQLFHAGLAVMGARRDAVVALAGQVARSRGFGDFYQDMLVAEGAGEIAIDFGIAPWDVAPLMVIVEEAGGRATSVAGERTIYAGDFVSSNGLLHDAVIAALAAAPE
jgi:histidinol-phosphatase